MSLNIISLFDGISVGQLALTQLGLKNYKYYASEINPSAIKITQANFPSTIQLGDVNSVSYRDGWLYSQNGRFYVGNIDLLLAGSPCQSFSGAGKMEGFNSKNGKLFFELIRLLEQITPLYFLVENVKMPDEFMKGFNSSLDVDGVLIDSCNFSAQRRERYYWSNINIQLLLDKIKPKSELTVKDILESTDPAKFPKAFYFKEQPDFTVNGKQILKIYRDDREDDLYIDFSKDVQNFGGCSQLGYINYRSLGNRVYSINGKSSTLMATSGGLGRSTNLYLINDHIRSLTPLESERLQTLPDMYSVANNLTNSVRFEALGNSWTNEVIKFILKSVL